MVIRGVVLAAGRSSRMGRAKALLPLGANDTFLTRIVRTLHDAGIDDVVVVVGHDADAIVTAAAGQDLRARFVVNREYDRGQLSSIVAGIDAVDAPELEAVILTLVDVPLVTTATVRAVVERFIATRAHVVRPSSGARHGHPLLLDRSLFDALRSADPARGAKPIVHAHLSADSHVEVVDEGAFEDFDTADDYRRILLSDR